MRSEAYMRSFGREQGKNANTARDRAHLKDKWPDLYIHVVGDGDENKNC